MKKIIPLRHRLLIRATLVVPHPSWFPGFTGPALDYHPEEVPAFVRKRLVDFLECRYPIPPRYLRNLIPPDQVRDARRTYRQLLATGLGQGEAVLAMGLAARNLGHNLPESALAEIIASNCSCIGDHQYGIIASSAGEPIDRDLRIIECSEVAAAAEKETAQEIRKALADAENRRRLAFEAARQVAV